MTCDSLRLSFPFTDVRLARHAILPNERFWEGKRDKALRTFVWEAYCPLDA